MEEKEEREDQGIIKTLAADPNVLAAILDKENSTEFVQNSDEVCSDNLNEETLHKANQNGDIQYVMDGNEGIFENNGGDLNEVVEDSLEIKSEAGDIDNGSQTTERSLNLLEDNSDDLNSKTSIKEGSTKSTVSASPSSKNDKQRNSAVDNKKQGKQKPKVDFIDQNRGNFSRKPGKSSYAAIYSQKLKLKQGYTNGKNSKANASASESKEKEIHLQQENDKNYRENISLEQYDKFNESFSPFTLRPSNSSTYTNVNKGLYYNVDTYNIPNVTDYTQTAVSNMNQSLLPDSYLNQPYQVPSKGFGLRYSNYGYQSYQTASAMTYPQQSNALNTLPGTQLQGYESQSAPPGPSYYQRRPLIDQVEFFPEHDHFLSQSLTNSQFINPQQIYQRDSVLERVPEPHLSNSPYLLSSDRVSKISGREINSKLSKPVDFKPYTLKDYRQIKNEQSDMLGSLGPNTESEDYKEKITKLNKQRQYAEIIRLEHATRKKQWEKKAAPPPAPAQQLQAEAKRQAAINYSKTIPKPKVMESRQPKGRNVEDTNDEEKEVTLLEVLKMRHEQEKNKVQALRKEITSKPNS